MSTRSERLSRLKRGEEARQRVLSGQNVRSQPQEPQESSRLRALSAFDEQASQRTEAVKSAWREHDAQAGRPQERNIKIVSDEDYMRANSALARDSAERNQAELVKRQQAANAQAFDAAGLGFGGQRFNEHMSNVKNVAENVRTKAVAEKAAQDKWDQEHHRNTPVVGPILRGLDWLAKETKPASDIALEYYTPGAGMAVLGGATQAAGNLISKAAPGLARTAAGRVAQTAAREAAVGAPVAVGNQLARDMQSTPEQLLEAGAYGAGGGALLGGVGRLGLEGARSIAGRAASDVAKNAIRNSQIIETAGRGHENTPLLPPPRVRGNAPTVDTPDIINVPETAPRGLPAPNMAPPTTGRIERTPNVYRQKLETLFAAARQMDMPPGREREYLDDIWSRMAGREDPSLDELINLAYPPNRVTTDLASRARAAQQKRDMYGVPLPAARVSERYQGGVLGAAEPPTQRYVPTGERPTAPARQPEVLNADVAPSRPRVDVTPEQEVEQIVQSVQQPGIRDRVYNYLDEAEKAAKERIRARRGRLSSTPVDEWTDYAIVGAAKLGKGTIKLADFTEEMVREFGEQVRPHAQRIYGMAKEQLRQQERRASKEGEAAAAFNESGVGNANSFDQKISRSTLKRAEPFNKRWEKIRTQFVDDAAPFEGLEKRVRGRVASAEDSLYKSARTFKGVPEKASQLVTRSLSPIVKAVEKAGYSADDLGRYALAKHARDVNAAGYKSGFTNAEIEDVIRRYGTPEMEAAQQSLVQVNRGMLQELVNTGVVSKQLADTLNERWKNYIPLFRAFDDDAVAFEGGLSKALANVASPIKSLQGSERAVIDPLENMVKNIFRSVNAAERNKVASQLVKLSDIDTAGKFIRRLDPSEEVGRKNVVNVKVNGENVKYEVEPEVYKAMLNLDQESSNMVINMLSKPASLLRAGATLTPEFSLRNPLRDVVQAFVVSKSGFNPLIDFPVGIIQSIAGKFGKGKLYQDWINNLGAYGNIISMDRNVHRQALQKVLREPISKKFVNVVTGRSLIRLLRAISDTTESATKVGEYRAALRKGVSKEEAAYRSRDIMDFARAGTSVRQANKIIAFLNANIQGKSKLIRAIKENPVGTTFRALTAVTLPTIGVFAMQKYWANETQKETIDNAPDWMRNSFWLVPLPGTDVVARIPKPFDLAAIFANLPERALDHTYNNDKEAFDGFVRQSLSESAIPTQISGLLPMIEGMSNYSFFRQGDIIPQREQGLAFSDQYDPVRTTETAKFLAKGAEALTGGKGPLKNFSSPRIMDNTIQGLTAGLGKYATDAIDTVLQKTGAVDRPKPPAKKMEQQPLLRSFLVDPTQGGKVMDKFYTEMDDLNKEKSSNKYNDVTFGKVGKKDLNLPAEKESLLKSMNKTSDKVSAINKEIRTIERSMTLAPRQKRDQIDALMAQRTQLIKGAVALLPK